MPRPSTGSKIFGLVQISCARYYILCWSLFAIISLKVHFKEVLRQKFYFLFIDIFNQKTDGLSLFTLLLFE